MQNNDHQALVGFIWNIANKLRGPYRPPQYRKVMLPLIVLRRLDTVLEPTKALVLAHVKPHDFRRFVGTQLAKRDIRLAQNQLGHTRIETTVQDYVLDDVRLGVIDDLI